MSVLQLLSLHWDQKAGSEYQKVKGVPKKNGWCFRQSRYSSAVHVIHEEDQVLSENLALIGSGACASVR